MQTITITYLYSPNQRYFFINNSATYPFHRLVSYILLPGAYCARSVARVLFPIGRSPAGGIASGRTKAGRNTPSAGVQCLFATAGRLREGRRGPDGALCHAMSFYRTVVPRALTPSPPLSPNPLCACVSRGDTTAGLTTVARHRDGKREGN